MQTRNCKSLEVQAEMKCGSGTSHLWKSWQNKCGKRNFRSSDQSRQSGNAGAELHIFGSQGRAEVRKRNFTFLAVNAERKCGRGTSDLWQSRQSGKCGSGTSGLWQLRQSRSVEVEFQIFSRQERKCSQAL